MNCIHEFIDWQYCYEYGVSSLFLSHSRCFVRFDMHLQVVRYTFAQGCVLVSMDRDIDSSRDQNPRHVTNSAT